MNKKYDTIVTLSESSTTKNFSYLKESIKSNSFPQTFWNNFISECVIKKKVSKKGEKKMEKGVKF
jgi:hypothetical protein